MGFIRDLSGATAAEDAAGQQSRAADRAIDVAEESRDIARGDLEPYRNFGQSQMAGLEAMFTPEGQQAYLESNPMFAMSRDNLNQETMKAMASRGRLGTGDTLNEVSMNTLRAGQPLIDRQTNNLFNAVNMGQSSAAGQANTALQSGAGISDLLTQQGNAQAAGTMGRYNQQSGFWSNVLNASGVEWGSQG